MKSMTGYAYAAKQDENISVSVELKGCNNRFLEIQISLPAFLAALEPGVREYLSGRFNRGKIEAAVRLKEHNAPVLISVNREAVRAYKAACAVLAEELQSGETPPLAAVLGMEGVLDIEKSRDNERYRRLIEPVLQTAADSFEAERVREGKHTEADILAYIAGLEAMTARVSDYIPDMERAFQENLRSRFTEVLGDAVDENRVLTETAALLVKYTIAEEVSRLSSHLAEFRAEAGRNGSPGKKLDFLCQEINREINTIGSKTPNLEVSRTVVNMKDALENIREQLRNVE
ncbi:MAG: YicC family protein [Spirochaetaceae bacterium]|jgi:uncharacterized protein (TIGR00255 family)|nr:YicC family protein [Spirochaetaceae bacterium]